MISIIVPCYNEQEALPIFCERTIAILQSMKISYEILFIDDGSKDETKEILKKVAQNNNQIYYLSFSKNFGKEAAMYAGFCNVNGEYVVVMDADMQDPPELLPKMLQIIQTGEYDSVATRRITREGEPII